MPKEKFSIFGMIAGDEPGPIARFMHNLFDGGEGDWGEMCIEKLLKNRMADASFFRNVYVPFYDRTAELDVVMVSKKGIFVFESKAYGGNIYGDTAQMEWLQCIGRTESLFYNPVKQNENHCRHISNALKISKNSVFSFVVFENRADLSEVLNPVGKNFVVCNRKNLVHMLNGVLYKRTSVFSKEEIVSICRKLEEWSNADASIKEKHIQNVQNRVLNDKCPVCGRELIERNGKYGVFVGCSGFPNCRYTRDVIKN